MECWLEDVLKKKEKEAEIFKVLNVEKALLDHNGGNYLSDIVKLKVQVQLVSGRKKVTSLIMKILPEGDIIKEFVHGLNAFEREVKIYQVILEIMEHLMEEFGDTREKLWSDMISYHPYDTIVFKDLTAEGYIVHDRKKSLNMDHGLLVMEGLARMHAMSRILLDRGRIVARDLGVYGIVTKRNEFDCLWGDSLSVIAEEINKWGTKWVDVGNKLEKSKERMFDKLNDLYRVDEMRFNVMNHGDPWTCNMMFKNGCGSNVGKPIGVKFIDFQVCHYNTPAWDLTYFMCTSMEQVLRRENERVLLERYVDTLNASLDVFKHEGPRLELESLISDMKRIELFRVMLVLIAFPVMTSGIENAFNFERAFKNKCGINVALYQDENGARIRKLIGPDLLQFVYTGLIP